MKMARIVTAGLVSIGIAEIAFQGTDAALYAWYLLFVLWLGTMVIRFIQAAFRACKAVFTKGPGGEMSFPEFEQRMTSFNRGGDKDESDPSGRTTTSTESQDGTGDLFDDFRLNPIIREDDPFGLFLGD